MAWLARSIANTLKLDDDDDDEEVENDNLSASKRDHSTDHSNEESHQNKQQSNDPSSPVSPSRGVREDLSELTKTLSRQFWGVASFLAPPPQSEQGKPLNEFQSKADYESDPDKGRSESLGPVGIRNDFAELGGKFRSGISKLSSNMAVSEITKIASNILNLGSDEELSDDSGTKGAVGVTEEVVSFARDIATHPETWLDFPLPENEEDEDFVMTDAQQDHALAVEHLSPRLAALRIELCPGHMSESHFWKIYFILVQPRLDKDDAQLLSTPQIAKARASLGQELRSQSEASPQDCNEISPDKECLSSAAIAEDSDAEKLPDTNAKVQIVDETVIEEGVHGSEDDADDWLNEESSEMQGGMKTGIHIENEDDVSFSDLEEDDDVPISDKKERNSCDKDSSSPDWVQLKNSSADTSSKDDDDNVEKVNVSIPENKESNDWLDIDDIEVA